MKIFNRNNQMACLLETQDADHGPNPSRVFSADEFGSEIVIELWKAKLFGMHDRVHTKELQRERLIGKKLVVTWLND